MKFCRGSRLFLLMVLALALSSTAGSEVDILVKILANKGLISQQEAEAILTRAEKQQSAAKNAVKEVSIKKGFLGKTTFKSDLRLRHQIEKRDGRTGRHRNRLRFRHAFETKVNEEWKAGARLVTGGTDPRSTNQTFQDNFSTKGIQLDKAYVSWQPFSRHYKKVKLTGGKFGNPFFTDFDLLFDTDITFEGAALNLVHKESSRNSILFNSGFFTLDEFSGNDFDPEMYISQIGIKHVIRDGIDLTVTANYYGFSHLKGKATLETATATNTFVNGLYRYDYDALGFSAGYSNDFLRNGKEFNFSLYADYIKNQDSSDKGYLGGLIYGYKSYKKRNHWQVEFCQRKLEQDAFSDCFPDSDFYSGTTGVKGFEALFFYGLSNNVYLCLDYYSSKRINNPTNKEKLLQIDLSVKF